MVNLLPYLHLFGKRLGLLTPRALSQVARRSWQIAPAETTTQPSAIFLSGQLERVTGWDFADEHPGREMIGGQSVQHGATQGFLLEDAWLCDGGLYKDDAAMHLHPRQRRWPDLRVETELPRAALYSTFGGNRYFGQWLMDDCPTYSLAVAEGTPVCTALEGNPHAQGYEDGFDMRPTRVASAYFRELVIFDDVGQNRHKHARFRALGDKLRARHGTAAPLAAHPGVFILRGRTGAQRVLGNELDLAERLRARRGLRIVDPTQLDVPGLVAACAGARLVVGVEGSGLLHGILHLPPGGALVTLQPAWRFVSLLKHLTDRDGQHFAFVVGAKSGAAEFLIDGDELERTLDLLPRPAV